VTEIGRLLAAHGIHCVVVAGIETRDDSDERLAWGIVSDLDLVVALTSEAKDAFAWQLAATAIVTVEPTDSLEQAAELMTANNAQHLVVPSFAVARPGWRADISDGSRSPMSARPTSSALCSARSRRSRLDPRRAKSSGSIAFSSAVSVRNSWKNWNTTPTCRPRQTASSSSLMRSISLAAHRDRTRRRAVDPGDLFMIVDLPLRRTDDRDHSPSPSARSIPRSAA
jgi:hypothetical protein